MQYKVSIVIPVYNVAKYLDECVNSVINQTYKNIEIILVDDGSTDDSGVICDGYAGKDERIKVYHKANGGLSDARNYGMDRATGTYIYFLDSDDYIERFAIEALVETAENNSADVVLFDARVIDEEGVQQMDLPSYMRYYRVATYEPCTGKEMFRSMVKNKEHRSAVPLLFLRREAVKCRFESILHEDELFTIQLLYSVSKAVHYGEMLYVRRVRAGSITTLKKAPKNYRGVKAVMMELAQIPEFDHAIADYMARLYISQQLTYCGLTKKEKKEIKKEKKELDYFLVRNQFFGSEKLKRAYAKWNIPSYATVGNELELKIGKRLGRMKEKQGYEKRMQQLGKGQGESRVFVIGTPKHGNLGDHAIAIAEEGFIREVLPEYRYVEIEMPFYRNCKEQLREVICPKDLVVISGGGWMGNQWFHNELTIREIVKTYPNNPIVIFPQTIYYEAGPNRDEEIQNAKEIYSAHQNMLICLRDKASYLFAKENGLGNCIYVPDIALYEKWDSFGIDRSGVLICQRYDCEKCVQDETWTQLEQYFRQSGKDVRYTTTIIDKLSPENRKSAFLKKLYEFSRAELIVTDRLHAMIFATITGTPCIAFDNTSKKVSGVFEWIRDLGYVKCVEDGGQAQEVAVQLLAQKTAWEYRKPDFTALRDALTMMKTDAE